MFEKFDATRTHLAQQIGACPEPSWLAGKNLISRLARTIRFENPVAGLLQARIDGLRERLAGGELIGELGGPGGADTDERHCQGGAHDRAPRESGSKVGSVSFSSPPVVTASEVAADRAGLSRLRGLVGRRHIAYGPGG